jgi:hypothetical protein
MFPFELFLIPRYAVSRIIDRWRLEKLAPFGGKARNIGLSPKAKDDHLSKGLPALCNTRWKGPNPVGSCVRLAGASRNVSKRCHWLTEGTQHSCQAGDHKPTEPGIILSRTRAVEDLVVPVCKPVCPVRLQIIPRQISRVFSFVPEINPLAIERNGL